MICQNIPTKIDLYTENLVVFNTQDFRIAPLFSIRLRHFIGRDNLIVVFYEPQKFEPLTLPGSRPASLKISFAIKSHVEWTGKSEIRRKMLFEKFPIAGSKSFVRSLCQ